MTKLGFLFFLSFENWGLGSQLFIVGAILKAASVYSWEPAVGINLSSSAPSLPPSISFSSTPPGKGFKDVYAVGGLAIQQLIHRHAEVLQKESKSRERQDKH